MSAEKRAKKQGKPVDGGHPKPNQSHPTGKSAYAQRAANKQLQFSKLLEDEQTVPPPAPPRQNPPSNTVNSNAPVEAPVTNAAIEVVRATPTVTASTVAATGVLSDDSRRAGVIGNFAKLPQHVRQALIPELTRLAALPDGKTLPLSKIPRELRRQLGRDALLKYAGTPFARACMECTFDANPLGYEGDEQKYFQGLMAIALGCAHNRYAAMQDNYRDSFPSLLGDFILKGIVNKIERHDGRYGNENRQRYSFLIDEPQPGRFCLKPHVADALEAFARDCIQKHGHLIGTSFDLPGLSH